MRRILVFGSLLLAVGAGFYFWSPETRPGGTSGMVPARESRAGPDGTTRTPTGPAETPPTSARRPETGGTGLVAPSLSPAQLAADFPIAAPLNAPDSNIARDLDIVRQLFETWQSNFPREGNPIGENAEITAALMGRNRLDLALIPPGHRALNEQGELCDRWGTPFRFHQLSGSQMEVRSAGPDRKFATEDDAVLTPP